jgi:hypothetical protein
VQVFVLLLWFCARTAIVNRRKKKKKMRKETNLPTRRVDSTPSAVRAFASHSNPRFFFSFVDARPSKLYGGRDSTSRTRKKLSHVHFGVKSKNFFLTSADFFFVVPHTHTSSNARDKQGV